MVMGTRIELGPLEKQPVLLTTEPSLWPTPGHFIKAEDLGLAFLHEVHQQLVKWLELKPSG